LADPRAGAITEPLEHAGTDLELLLRIDLAHRHMILFDISENPRHSGA
jgi:hypothetical protein